MKKLIIVSYFFSIVSFAIFILSLLSSKDDPIRLQALYWFALSVVTAFLPEIQRFKIKDIEIDLKKNLEKVERKVDELSDTFFTAINRVWQVENEMPPSLREQRNEHWDRFQKYVDSLEGQRKLEVQMKNTKYYLIDFKISCTELKEKLGLLGFYDGHIDNKLDENLINAIIKFQRDYNLRHIDGIFGPLTYQKMIEVLSKGPKKVSVKTT